MLPTAELYKKASKKGSFKKKFLGVLLIILLAGAIAGAVVAYNYYNSSLKPVSGELTQQFFTVEQGSTTRQIADSLKQKGLIKNEKAFELYVRLKGGSLQAGTYALAPAMSTQQIASVMLEGKVNKDLLTILPGKRLDQIKRAFEGAGFSETEVNNAFNADNYRNHAALKYAPKDASLEGYLYPDSYERLAETSAETIVRSALDQMALKLTPKLVANFKAQGLSVHEAVIIGSIVDQEVSNPIDKPIVAQVFIKRLREGIPLGADPTAVYASVLAGEEPSVGIDSPYNTRIYKGLPPGPIGNVSVLGLEAVANPANTDWLFFVAGDDGKTHFSKTQAEHEALTEKYCKKLCQ